MSTGGGGGGGSTQIKQRKPLKANHNGKKSEKPQAKRTHAEAPDPATETQESGAASSRTTRSRLTNKRPPESGKLEEPTTKQAKNDENEAMMCIANAVAEAVDYTGKALSTVNDAMREEEPEMMLNTLTPTTQYEARVKEIAKIEKQEAFEDVSYKPDVQVISVKWVDTEKTPGVAKARWVLRGFEELAAKDDCYAATASLVAVRMILVWMLVARQKIPEITLFLGDIKGAFLNAFMTIERAIIAQPPPE